MAEPGSHAPSETTLIEDLSAEQRGELERRHYVRVGDELVWTETDGRVRRERVRNLYYVQTARGIFRVSRVTGEVVEV